MGEAFVKHDMYDILRNQSRPTSISARKLKYQILLFRGKPLQEIQNQKFKLFGVQTWKTNPSKVAFPAKCQKFVFFQVIGIGLNDSSSRLEETFLLQEKIENVCLHNEARRHSKRNLKEKVCNQSD